MVLSENKEEEMVFKVKNLIFKVSHTLVVCVSHAPCGVFPHRTPHQKLCLKLCVWISLGVQMIKG